LLPFSNSFHHHHHDHELQGLVPVACSALLSFYMFCRIPLSSWNIIEKSLGHDFLKFFQHIHKIRRSKCRLKFIREIWRNYRRLLRWPHRFEECMAITISGLTIPRPPYGAIWKIMITKTNLTPSKN